MLWCAPGPPSGPRHLFPSSHQCGWLSAAFSLAGNCSQLKEAALHKPGPNDRSRSGCEGRPLPRWGMSLRGHLSSRASLGLAEASVLTALLSTPPPCPGSARLLC